MEALSPEHSVSLTRKSTKPSFAAFLALMSFVAFAAGGLITIDTRNDSGYGNLSNVSGTNIDTEHEVRIAGLTQLAGQYRLRNGLSSLPAGTQFRVIWPNGSSERGNIVSPYSSVGAVPVPGTQSPSDLAPPLPVPSKPV